MRFPRTLLEFQAQFPDDAHCWAYLRQACWPRGFVCPRCGGRGSHFLASRRLEQCRACRYQSSVTAGTVFHGARGVVEVVTHDAARGWRPHALGVPESDREPPLWRARMLPVLGRGPGPVHPVELHVAHGIRTKSEPRRALAARGQPLRRGADPRDPQPNGENDGKQCDRDEQDAYDLHSPSNRITPAVPSTWTVWPS